VVLGRILKGGYRDRVYLATKCPTWLIEKHEDFDKYLDIQLSRLQTDRIDMYLMHSLNKDRWNVLVENDVFSFMERAKQDGRIRFAGFSFHDNVELFKAIVDAYHWDFCQIQYNYMDEEFQAGTEGLKYAAGKNLAVVIMEPLRGGRLVWNIPAEVQEIMDRSGKGRTPADWALRWVWNHPEVTVVLSGMGKLREVKENIETARTALPNSLTPEDLAMFEEIKESYRKRVKVQCTGCEYCLPCPQGIVIPEWFDHYNEAHMYNTFEYFKRMFQWISENQGNPENCVECGDCEASCPQSLPIRELLKQIRGAGRQ
jgi:predicted aldo/keto reductase-like oxidoreductase